MTATWNNLFIRILVVIATSLAATAASVFVFAFHFATGALWAGDGTLELIGQTTVKTNVWWAQGLVLPAWFIVELSAWLRKRPFPAWSYVLFLGVFWFAMGVLVIAQSMGGIPVHWLIGYGLANLAGLAAGAAFWWFWCAKRQVSQIVPDVF